MWHRSVTVLVILGLASQNADARASHSGPRRNLGIVGGTQVKINQVPFMALLWDGEWNMFVRGAVIVHKQFVLSTKPILLLHDDRLRVVVGTDIIDDAENMYRVEKTFYTGENDYLMVVKLDKELMLNEKVQPIKMAAPDLVISDHEILDTMGFGQKHSYYKNIRPFEPSKNLLKVDIPYVNQEKCNETYTDIKIGEICAGGIEGQGSCFGDMGGPLRYKDTLVGLACRLYDSIDPVTCAKAGVPAVFTSVAYHRRYIDDVIEKNYRPKNYSVIKNMAN